MLPASSSIHPTAVLHPDAQIDEGVEIGPYAVIGPGVTIRSGTSVGAHAVLESAEIGPGCRIFPGSFIGTAPQDIGDKGHESRVIIGAETIIRECVTVHRSKFEGGLTRVGERCMLMACSHVAHDCLLGQGVVIANHTALAGHAQVGDGAFLSAFIGVHQFVRIGKLTMIAAGSMVSQDVPPFCVAQGDRAKLFGLNRVGLKRARLDLKSIADIKSAYRTVFLSALNLQDALERISHDPNPHVKEFAEFIKGSKRGVCRPSSDSPEEDS